MRVKKYVAPSMPEAMKMIREDLGEDAVILHSKIVYTGGFLGLFKKKNIEIIAAKDGTVIKESQKAEPMNKQMVKPSQSLLTKKLEADSDDQKEKEQLKQDIDELKQLLSRLTASSSWIMNYPESIQRVVTKLHQHEVDGDLLQLIADDALQKFRNTKEAVDSSMVEKWMKSFLIELLRPAYVNNHIKMKKFINFVGPTGVGKTTTLAKVAAQAVLMDKKKIGFITTDTYRIAAIDQLKTYANLLNVPVEVVYKPDDFRKAVEKLQSLDHIFIDTAGRNYLDEQYIHDLQELIDFNEEMTTYLVLSLTGKQKDLEAIVEKFFKIPIDQFIFTKFDETTSIGVMVNLLYKYRIGAAFVTNGQNVPDDLVPMNEEILVNMVFEGE
jgi:flagellar biosynthesis protein FlhF